MTGIQLIALERQRQVDDEGCTPECDALHGSGDLALAAIAYAHEGVAAQGEWVNHPRVPRGRAPQQWPWDSKFWKPSDDPVRNLVKAGALIAAEIDRLQRAALLGAGGGA